MPSNLPQEDSASSGSSSEVDSDDERADDSFVAMMQAKMKKQHAAHRPVADCSSFQALVGTRFAAGGVASAGLVRAALATVGAAAHAVPAPTDVQRRAWETLGVVEDTRGTSGGGGARDLLALSKTGSGKTLAFLVPALAHAASRTREQGGQGSEGAGRPAQPLALIVAPTRELCLQIGSVAEAIATHPDFMGSGAGGCDVGGGDSSAVGVSVFCAIGGVHYGRCVGACHARNRAVLDYCLAAAF